MTSEISFKFTRFSYVIRNISMILNFWTVFLKRYITKIGCTLKLLNKMKLIIMQLDCTYISCEMLSVLCTQKYMMFWTSYLVHNMVIFIAEGN
jgi:hypothetical protein